MTHVRCLMREHGGKGIGVEYSRERSLQVDPWAKDADRGRRNAMDRLQKRKARTGQGANPDHEKGHGKEPHERVDSLVSHPWLLNHPAKQHRSHETTRRKRQPDTAPACWL